MNISEQAQGAAARNMDVGEEDDRTLAGERERAELALLESQEHFRYMTQTVPGVLWTGMPDGRIDFVSDASVRELGETPERLREHGWIERVHPDDVERVLALWRKSLATGALLDNQYRMLDARNKYRTFQARAECRRDESGKILRWYGMLIDIDKLVRTQERLADSEERLRATIQAAPGLTWSANADGRIDFMSDATRSLFGREPDEMLGLAWRDWMHPDHVDRVHAVWQRARETATSFQVETPFRTSGGDYHWFSFRAIGEKDASGRVVRWYGSGSDIDEFKRAQSSAEAASRAKSAFLSTMSHEIRTPLNAVLGFAGLLADTGLGAQQREFVNSIRASGDHLLGVINDILDFSKLESGSLSLEFAPCDVQRTVEGALDLVASQAAAKRLELVSRIDEGVPPACVADQARLRQVLVNLLSNAVKFTESGEVVVHVKARALGADEHEFEFRVTDTGIGIPADRLDRLFRDFSQVDDSISRRFGGSGLGLAISKRLVEAHGGVMAVESAPGRGSTFTFRIPAAASASPERDMPVSTEALRDRRVLLVDDNRSNLDLLTLQVQAWDMDAIPLLDPAQAPDMVARAVELARPFDLAIVDHRMPAIDGLELARRIRALSPMPIVLLTSLGTTLEIARSGGADIAAVQTKPIHRSALLETLCAVLASPGPAVPAANRDAAPIPKLKLLVVEDNLVNRKVALLVLRKIGYTEVDVAVDGLEAVEAVKAQPYDVVLMDVQMPNLDGLDATRRIRAEVPPGRQPQIVAMTANAMVEDRETCIAAGMDDHIAKPIVPEHLLQALLMAAERRGVAAPGPAPARKQQRDERGEADLRARRIAEQVLSGGGEMGALMRRIDWEQTPVGPVYAWPQSLRTALSILLSQTQPIFLMWGRERVQFYNDAYRPILGTAKHPRAMGQRARECWAEAWDVLAPSMDAVQNRGESTVVERGLLCIDRFGFLEETYFTYGYSPIREESGGIGGIFVSCTENTGEVLGARRSELLIDLSIRLSAAADSADLWRLVRDRLATATYDLPFVLAWRVDAARVAHLECAIGLEAGAPLVPLCANAGDLPWPIDAAHRSGRPAIVTGLAARLVPMGPWPEAPDHAIVLGLGAWGALVLGTSPRLRFDEAYRRFCENLAAILASALARLPAPG